MIVTLSGKNEFLINQEIRNIISEYIKVNGDLNVKKIIDTENLDLKDLILDLKSNSLFAENKLFIIYEPSNIKDLKSDFEDFISSINGENQIILVETNIPKSSTFYKYLQKNTDFIIFNELKSYDLSNWAVEYAKSLEAKLDKGTADYLINRIGLNQLILSSEINKLAIYDSDITRSSIDLLTERSPQSTIFSLLDAAFNMRSKEAIEIYADQRQQRVEPEYMISMLVWQMNILAIVISAKNMAVSELASISKISEYTINNTKKLAGKISYSKLKRLVSDLCEMDMRSKTESYDLDQSIKNFIISLGS